jgi:hypothetical protein
MSWQMTVANTYERVTWRLVIGGKSRQRGLAMNGKGKGLTVGTNDSYGMGHDPRNKWDKWTQWRMMSMSDGLSDSM